MDVSDIIYIIIGVLWFVFSIVGGAAKAKKQAANKKPADQKTSIPGTKEAEDVRKMLEDLLQGKKAEVRPVKKSPIQKKGPSKLEIHKEHVDFIAEKKKKKKDLEVTQDSLSSHKGSPFSTTSSSQHPPDLLPADQAASIVSQFKDVNTGKHPLMEDFDAQKALIFSEIFSRRFH